MPHYFKGIPMAEIPSAVLVSTAEMMFASDSESIWCDSHMAHIKKKLTENFNLVSYISGKNSQRKDSL